MTLKANLVAARELIADEAKWSVDGQHMDQGRLCAVQAIAKVIGSTNVAETPEYAALCSRRSRKGAAHMQGWNPYPPGTTIIVGAKFGPDGQILEAGTPYTTESWAREQEQDLMNARLDAIESSLARIEAMLKTDE